MTPMAPSPRGPLRVWQTLDEGVIGMAAGGGMSFVVKVTLDGLFLAPPEMGSNLTKIMG